MHVDACFHVLRNEEKNIKQPNTKWQFLKFKINNQVIVMFSIGNKQFAALAQGRTLYAH